SETQNARAVCHPRIGGIEHIVEEVQDRARPRGHPHVSRAAAHRTRKEIAQVSQDSAAMTVYTAAWSPMTRRKRRPRYTPPSGCSSSTCARTARWHGGTWSGAWST